MTVLQVNIQAHQAVVRLQAARNADPLPDLVALELSLGQQGIPTIALEFPPGAAVPTERLTRLNYRCLAPYRYIKTIPARRSVRFSITEKCNYRCFFCHEEGLQMDLARTDVREEDLFRLLDQLKDAHYNDFTFTGGEPLLKWRRIVRCLDYMRTIDYLPDVKFVSNGRALRPEFLTALERYPGKVRFNISMHSLDAPTHDRIVNNLDGHPSRPRDELARVRGNLALLREAGFPFKLNFVLLKSLNTQPKDIADILDYALAVGARRVKFLELLLTEKLKHLYPYYYRLQALKDQLGDQLEYLDQGQRRTVYRYRDTPLEVELQSCTCSHGCNVCALNRDVNFTAELRYFPCFLRPETGADLRQTTLAEAVPAGADFIAEMADHYGDHSPIIIRDHYLTRHEAFFFYEIAAEDLPSFQDHLKQDEHLKLVRQRGFAEYYYSDGSPPLATFGHVHKLAHNTYEHRAMEIRQQHRVDPNGTGHIATTFECDGQYVPSIDDYTAAMAQKGFAVVLRAEWSIDYYAASGRHACDLGISIGTVPNRATALVRATQPLTGAPCTLRPLRHSVPAWLATGKPFSTETRS